MHGSFVAKNGRPYKSAIGHRGRALPSTTQNPWLKQVFDEQDRLGVKSSYLARAAKLDVRTIDRLRHPSATGKHPTWDQVVRLAEAMDFRVPHQLIKGD